VKILSLSAALMLSTIMLSPQDSPQSYTPVIAVLEDTQLSAKATRMVVHALFAKLDTGWVALTDRERYDRAGIRPNMKWTIAYDDRKLGEFQVANQWPSLSLVWDISRDMIVDVSPNLNLPLVPNTEQAFTGWNKTPEYRPLILTNSQSIVDPEGWVSFMPDTSATQSLFPAFKQIADIVQLGEDRYRKDRGILDYGPSHLVPVAGYRNRQGMTIVAIRLNPALGEDSYVLFLDQDWFVHWFLLADEPVLLGRCLELIDVGDYDGDGTSEILCWYSAYNKDGYSLLCNNLTRRIDCWWSYH
jgi:hypothetical protein